MYPRLNLLYKELKSNGTTAETTLRSAVRRFYRMRKNERVFSKTFLAAVDQIPTDFDSNRVVGAFLQSDPIQIALQLHHYELALCFSIPPIEFLGTSFSPVKHIHRFHTLHQNLKSWPLFLLHFLPATSTAISLFNHLLDVWDQLVFTHCNLSSGFSLYVGMLTFLSDLLSVAPGQILGNARFRKLCAIFETVDSYQAHLRTLQKKPFLHAHDLFPHPSPHISTDNWLHSSVKVHSFFHEILLPRALLDIPSLDNLNQFPLIFCILALLPRTRDLLENLNEQPIPLISPPLLPANLRSLTMAPTMSLWNPPLLTERLPTDLHAMLSPLWDGSSAAARSFFCTVSHLIFPVEQIAQFFAQMFVFHAKQQTFLHNLFVSFSTWYAWYLHLSCIRVHQSQLSPLLQIFAQLEQESQIPMLYLARSVETSLAGTSLVVPNLSSPPSISAFLSNGPVPEFSQSSAVEISKQLFTTHVRDLAHHLTLWELAHRSRISLFAVIHFPQLFPLLDPAPPMQLRSAAAHLPAIQANLQHNYNLFRALVWLVASLPDHRHRSQIVSHLIQVADNCLSWRNMQTAGTIIASLTFLMNELPFTHSLLTSAARYSLTKLRQLFPAFSGLGIGPQTGEYKLLASENIVPQIPLLTYFLHSLRTLSVSLRPLHLVSQLPKQPKREPSRLSFFSRKKTKPETPLFPPNISANYGLPDDVQVLDGLIREHLNLMYFCPSTWFGSTDVEINPQVKTIFQFVPHIQSSISEGKLSGLLATLHEEESQQYLLAPSSSGSSLPSPSPTLTSEISLVINTTLSTDMKSSAPCPVGFTAFIDTDNLSSPEPSSSSGYSLGSPTNNPRPMGFLASLDESDRHSPPTVSTTTRPKFHIPLLDRLKSVAPSESNPHPLMTSRTISLFADIPQLLNHVKAGDLTALRQYFTAKPQTVMIYFPHEDFGEIQLLHYVCLTGKFEVISLLLEFGASPLARTHLHAQLPLHLFVSQSGAGVSSSILRSTFKTLASVSDLFNPVGAQDYHGNTPLHLACAARHFWSVKLLILAKSSITVQNRSHQTPFDLLFVHHNLSNRFCRLICRPGSDSVTLGFIRSRLIASKSQDKLLRYLDAWELSKSSADVLQYDPYSSALRPLARTAEIYASPWKYASTSFILDNIFHFPTSFWWLTRYLVYSSSMSTRNFLMLAEQALVVDPQPTPEAKARFAHYFDCWVTSQQLRPDLRSFEFGLFGSRLDRIESLLVDPAVWDLNGVAQLLRSFRTADHLHPSQILLTTRAEKAGLFTENRIQRHRLTQTHRTDLLEQISPSALAHHLCTWIFLSIAIAPPYAQLLQSRFPASHSSSSFSSLQSSLASDEASGSEHEAPAIPTKNSRMITSFFMPKRKAPVRLVRSKSFSSFSSPKSAFFGVPTHCSLLRTPIQPAPVRSSAFSRSLEAEDFFDLHRPSPSFLNHSPTVSFGRTSISSSSASVAETSNSSGNNTTNNNSPESLSKPELHLVTTSHFDLTDYLVPSKCVTHWVIITILNEALLEVRVAFARKFIKTACLCLEMNNYFIANAIVAAFAHPTLQMLKVTMSSLGYEAAEILEELKRTTRHPSAPLTNPDNYPIIESAAAALADVARIHSTMGPDLVLNRWAHVSKMEAIDKLLNSLLPFHLLNAECSYDSFHLDPAICHYLGSNCDVSQINLFSEAALRSIAEKRQTTEVKNTPMSILSSVRTENLAAVDLSSLHLSILSPRLIQQLLVLPLLSDLNLSNNGLLELPFAISQLTRLEALDVSFNRLDSIPTSVVNLKALKRFQFKHNPLERIPEKFRQPKPLMEYLLRQHRLSAVTSSSSSGTIRSTFAGAVAAPTVSVAPPIKWPHLKICVLGDNGVGKTSLVQKLREKFDPAIQKKTRTRTMPVSLGSTPAVEFSTFWIDSDMQVTTYDFKTSQPSFPYRIFFSKRALYIIVFDLRHAYHDTITGWLNQLNLVGPPAPPVLFIATHLDLVPIEEAKETMATIQKKFAGRQQILGFQVFSAVSNFGLDQIVQLISRSVEFKSLSNFQSLPLSWWTLYRLLLQQPSPAAAVPYISITDFRLMALDSGVTQDPSEVLSFFQESTQIIHHADGPPELRDLIFIEPSYLLSALSNFFTIAPSLIKEDFFLHLPDIHGILKPYTSIREAIVCLLHRYQQCFQVSPTCYFLPALLSPEPPQLLLLIHNDGSSPSSSPYREYSRVFIFPSNPIGFFGELSAYILSFRLLANVQEHIFWENGLYLRCSPPDAPDDSQHAMVIFDPEIPSLSVTLILPDPDSTADSYVLFDWILECIQNLLDGVYASHKVGTRSIIPCPMCMNRTRLRHMNATNRNSPTHHIFFDMQAAIAKWAMQHPLEPEDAESSRLTAHFASSLLIQSHIYFFSLEECTNLFESQELLKCGYAAESHSVSLQALAPDLCFCGIFEIPDNLVVVDQVIGQGAFGLVSSGIYLPGESSEINAPAISIALKELTVSHEPAVIQDFLHEILMMKNLDHPNVVGCIGISRRPLRIVLEYCSGGDLGNLVHDTNVTDQMLPKYFRLRLALDVINGLEYLHSLQPPMIHRDLRCPNIFLSVPIAPQVIQRIVDRQPRDTSIPTNQSLLDILRTSHQYDKVVAKIGDFGLARRGLSATLLASFRYLAPECINPISRTYNHSSDIYSFGMLLYEMFARTIPFDEFFEDPKFCRRLENNALVLNQQGLISAIINDNLRPSLVSSCPSDVFQLIQACWKPDPLDRLEANEVKLRLLNMLESCSPSNFSK